MTINLQTHSQHNHLINTGLGFLITLKYFLTDFQIHQQ
jgi:hypothetical protein